jgi:integrase
MSAKSFGTLFARLDERAGMTFPIFPHMLRHGCGYALANAGHDTRALAGGHDTRALAGLARAQKHSAHGALHGAGAGQVQELLAIGDLWR